MEPRCTHLDQVREVTPRTPQGCEECLKMKGWWVHLRLCLSCGHVGCCDQSPNKHATKHFHQSRHPIIRSFEPGTILAQSFGVLCRKRTDGSLQLSGKRIGQADDAPGFRCICRKRAVDPLACRVEQRRVQPQVAARA